MLPSEVKRVLEEDTVPSPNIDLEEGVPIQSGSDSPPVLPDFYFNNSVLCNVYDLIAEF